MALQPVTRQQFVREVVMLFAFSRRMQQYADIRLYKPEGFDDVMVQEVNYDFQGVRDFAHRQIERVWNWDIAPTALIKYRLASEDMGCDSCRYSSSGYSHPACKQKYKSFTEAREGLVALGNTYLAESYGVQKTEVD